MAETPDAARRPAPIVTLLDVGRQKYGDCFLLRFGPATVLIDGAHPGDDAPGSTPDRPPTIPEQLASLLGGAPPFALDLLVVTHAHLDHIGCLPRLIKADAIRPKWALVADPDLGWGRDEGSATDADAPASPSARRLIAALREEPLGDVSDARVVGEFLADAASLEDGYRAMLQTLSTRGTKVVRYVGPETPGLAGLLRAFRATGLEILGPSREHLDVCARAIAGRSKAAASDAADALVAVDGAAVSEVEAYRRAVAPSGADAADSGSAMNPAINNQSLVLAFRSGGASLLFTGDMQLAHPQVPGLADVMAQLRARVLAAAPYDFVKLGHHGSDNAMDPAILDGLKETPLLAISTGTDSPDHPNPKVLTLLKTASAARPRDTPLHWVRTDRNGQVTIHFGDKPEILLARGRWDDADPNARDDLPPVAPAPAAEIPARVVEAEARPASVSRSDAGDRVEVRAWVPHAATRVTLTIDVRPGSAGGPSGGDAIETITPQSSKTLPIAPGRNLPRLLVVTSREALSRNIGEAEAALVLRSLRERGLDVLDDLPAGLTDSSAASPRVLQQLIRPGTSYEGVLLLGGYDVVPAQRLDVLTPTMRANPALRALIREDPDDFLVWSDGIYGDTDGDGTSDLPVSRLPDGKERDLVYRALAARLPGPSRRLVIRNTYRPFADSVIGDWAGPPADARLLSVPHLAPALPVTALDSGHVYFMLHGDHLDTTQFWGEGISPWPAAFHLDNLRARSERFDGVVFSGCCWGALTVNEIVPDYQPGARVSPKTADSSIALAFLKAGAAAFVGCTGVHYSPTNRDDLTRPPAVEHFGGPLHRLFWSSLAAGHPPAKALRMAKIAYAQGMPYLANNPADEPVSRKILGEFVCLGLGW